MKNNYKILIRELSFYAAIGLVTYSIIQFLITVFLKFAASAFSRQ